jgi:hypothetical protein
MAENERFSEKPEAAPTAKVRKPPKPYGFAGGSGISIQRLKTIPDVWPIHPSIIRGKADDPEQSS